MSRQAIISIATAEIGVTELPPNSNNTPYGLWYGLNLVPWCGIFVSWVYEQAGTPLGHIDTDKGFHYVPSALNFWRAHSKITTDPEAGDIVCYDWQKGKANETAQEKLVDHTGLFKEWIDRKVGTFYTIEGNTSVSNNSNGGQVMLRQRNMNFVEAFVNPLNLPL